MARYDRIGFVKTLSEKEISAIREIYTDYSHNNLKMEAIKRLRATLNVGLVEAKDLIECFDDGGIDSVLFTLRPKPKERFIRYRRINIEEPHEKFQGCPICGREEPIDEVQVIASSDELIGRFCMKCYEYLIMEDTFLQSWGKLEYRARQVMRRIEKLTAFAEHLKK